MRRSNHPRHALRTSPTSGAPARNARPRKALRAPLALALAAALGLTPLAASAAQIEVFTGGDATGTTSTCTLRQAIVSMNNQSVAGSGCPVSGTFGSDDIIVFGGSEFPSSTNTTITLSGSSLYISDSNLSINAVLSHVTIDANQLSGVLYDVATAGSSLALGNLTLTNGKVFGLGAGIYARYTDITLISSTVTGNVVVGETDPVYLGSGGGIFATYGDVSLTGSVVSNNSTLYTGGGIYASTGNITLTDSTVSGNTAGLGCCEVQSEGGGIYASQGTVTLTNSTVSGNSVHFGPGGGIYSGTGGVTLTDSTVSSNTAGPPFPALNCRSYYGGNLLCDGGGIATKSASVTLNSSEVTGNVAMTDGAGVSTQSGQITLTQSTLSGNTAAFYNGGGIYATAGTVTLTDSTVSGNYANDAGGGVGVHSGSLTLTNTTVYGNTAYTKGGGIYVYNVSGVLTNSTVSGNSSPAGGGLYIGSSLGYLAAWNNIVSGNVGGGNDLSVLYTINFNGDFNLLGAVPDLNLNPLANNGGPTQTMLPQLDSAAIDAGICAGDPGAPAGLPTDDQRSVVRPQGLACDIGAVERDLYNLAVTVQGNGSVTAAAVPAPVSGGVASCTASGGSGCAADYEITTPPARVTLAEVPDTGWYFSGWGGDCSGSNNNPSTQVTLDQNRACTATFAGVVTTTITVTSADDPGTTSTCTLRQAINTFNDGTTSGADEGNCRANASGNVRSNHAIDTIVFDPTVFPSGGSNTIALSGSQLAISTVNQVVIDASANSNVTVDANRLSRVMNDSVASADASLTLSHLILRNGSVTSADCIGYNQGGGLCIPYANLTLTDSTVSGNSAEWGGGIYADSGSVTLTDSALSSNDATNSGGGLFAQSGSVTLTNSSVSGNSASGNSDGDGGGGICSRSGNLTLTNSTVSDNSAALVGGGIYSRSGSATLTNSTVSGNSVDFSGGGIYSRSGSATLTNSTVSGNSAAFGGGISALYSGALATNNSIVAGNTQSLGGDISGATASGSHNLIGSVANLNLGPLADNGGPTLTMAPQAGSVAINAGACHDPDAAPADGIPTADQRGVARPQGAACDIGAVEAATVGTMVVSSGSGQTTGLWQGFGSPLTVQAFEPAHAPAPGVRLHAAAAAPGQAGAMCSDALTDASGLARLYCRANGIAGTYYVQILAVGWPKISPAVFALTNDVGNGDTIFLDGFDPPGPRALVAPPTATSDFAIVVPALPNRAARRR